MLHKLHTDFLTAHAEHLRESLPRHQWEDTGGQHKDRLILMLADEVLKLRRIAGECHWAAYEALPHPVNVAKKHAADVLRKFWPLAEAVRYYDEEEED